MNKINPLFFFKCFNCVTLFFLIHIGNMNAQNYQWAFGIGGNLFDNGTGIGTDASGNVYVTGDFWNSIDADPGTGTVLLTATSGHFFYVAKYDPSGNYKWAFTLPAGYGHAFDMVMDDSANVIITGIYNNNGPVDFDPGPGVANLGTSGDPSFIAKYDSSGNYVWAKRLMGPQGSGCDANNIALDPAKNILVTGSFYDSIDFNPGPVVNMLGATNSSRDIFLGKYTPAGDYIWAFSLPGNTIDEEADVAADDSGNIYLTGFFGYNPGTIDMDPGPGIDTLTSSGVFSIFVAKYDSAGNYQWAFKLDAGPGGNCQGSNITIDDSSNIYLTGSFRYIVDLDPGTGVTNITYSGPSWGGFFAKYNSSGAFQWGFGLGGPGSYFYAGDIIARNDGTCYIGGGFNGSIDIDPGPAIYLLDQANGTCFVAHYNAAGAFLDAFNFGGSSCSVRKMSLSSSDDLLLTGMYTGTSDFDPGPASNFLTGFGQTDIFITKYSLNPNAVIETNPNQDIEIFPNPFSGNLTVKTNSRLLTRLTLFSITSEKISEVKLNKEQTAINLKNIPAGIYFVTITNEKESVVRKIIKE